MIRIIIEDAIVPKARPRVTGTHAFMPKNYHNWKISAIFQIRQQYRQEPMDSVKCVSIVLHGRHSRRGDVDNIAGSILDALAQAGVIRNDNLMVVPKLVIALEYDKKNQPTTIIEIDQ